MSNQLFLGSFAKIKRTESQINDLNAKVTEFLDSCPCERRCEINTDGTKEVWSFVASVPIPIEFAVMTGEILFNLRSSLDQMACELAAIESGSSKNTYFPFGKTLDIFESEILSKAKKMSSDAKDMIRALQPYNGGNDLLWTVHDLNRRDKHISLIPVNIWSSTRIRDVKFWEGDLFSIGSRYGRHMLYIAGVGA